MAVPIDLFLLQENDEGSRAPATRFSLGMCELRASDRSVCKLGEFVVSAPKFGQNHLSTFSTLGANWVPTGCHLAHL